MHRLFVNADALQEFTDHCLHLTPCMAPSKQLGLTCPGDVMPMVSPLEDLSLLYQALVDSVAAPQMVDGQTEFMIPEHFAPTQGDCGLVTEPASAVMESYSQLSECLEDLIGTTFATEMGEFIKNGSALPIPELTAKLEQVRGAIHYTLAPCVFSCRLLRNYENLSLLLQSARWPVPFSEEHNFLSDLIPIPGDALEITDPVFSEHIPLRSFDAQFTVALAELDRGLKRRPRKDGKIHLKLPGTLRPHTYAEGMHLIWSLAERAEQAAQDVVSRLAEVCRAVARWELNDLIMNRTIVCNPAHQSTIRTVGASLNFVFENIWNGVQLIGTSPRFDKFMHA